MHRHHNISFLLTDGFAEHVTFLFGHAANFLGDLDHLFLEDNQGCCGFEDVFEYGAFEFWVDWFDGFTPADTVSVFCVGVHTHWAWSV